MTFILNFLDQVNAKVDQVKQPASSAVQNAIKEFEGLVDIGCCNARSSPVGDPNFWSNQKTA
jgi:hypothetical protein